MMNKNEKKAHAANVIKYCIIRDNGSVQLDIRKAMQCPDFRKRIKQLIQQ